MSVLRLAKKAVRGMIRPRTAPPALGPEPFGGAEDAPITLVMVCSPGFDIGKPNAASTFRLGLCRGFAQIGARYELVSVADIAEALPGLKNPVISLSLYDYRSVSRQALKIISGYPSFVWVNPDFRILRDFWKKLGVRYDEKFSARLVRRVLESGPRFVWGNTTKSHLHCFSEWDRRGLKVLPLALALDTERYFPEPDCPIHRGVQMAFVGGYWAKKAVQFERYLRPYEDLLTVYGYSPWPYRGYRGKIPEEQERVLYLNARVSPAISESDAEATGDIVERVYKVLGSGGLAVTDVAPGYADLFSRDELLYPETIDEYHDMIRQSLKDETLNRAYRESGRKAVLARHTYRHRALQIVNELEMSHLLPQQ